MGEYIVLDSHKRYTLVEHEDVATGKVRQYRIDHAPGAIRWAQTAATPIFGPVVDWGRAYLFAAAFDH